LPTNHFVENKQEKHLARPVNPYPSEKQLEVVHYLVEYLQQHGYQPSQQEMADRFGVSRNAIRQRLVQLESRGIIKMPKREFERAVQLRNVTIKVSFNRDPSSGIPIAEKTKS
jgi:SOS-response transcriptional repressor LexA